MKMIQKRALTNQMQKLRNKYGIDIIKSGFELKKWENYQAIKKKNYFY